MILISEKMTKCKKCVTPQLRPLGISFGATYVLSVQYSCAVVSVLPGGTD